MEVFELAQVADIVGIPVTKAKNWTIGRPLTITPSVRLARGTGSRNLYDMKDAYKMAIAKEMVQLGLPTRAIESVLEQIKESADELSRRECLLIWSKRKKWSIEFRESSRNLQFTIQPENGNMLIFLDLKGIVQRIEDRLNKLKAKTST